MARAKHSESYSCHLYRLLVCERRHGGVAGVARKACLNRFTLADYCNGKRTCPADLPGRLYRATKDIDFLTPILAGAGVALVELPKLHPRARDLLGAAIDAQREVTEFEVAIREAVRDDRIDADEARAISKEWWEAVCAITGLGLLADLAHKSGEVWAEEAVG